MHLYFGAEMYSQYGSYFDFIPSLPIIAHCSDLLDSCEGMGTDGWNGMVDVLLRCCLVLISTLGNICDLSRVTSKLVRPGQAT